MIQSMNEHVPYPDDVKADLQYRIAALFSVKERMGREISRLKICKSVF